MEPQMLSRESIARVPASRAHEASNSTDLALDHRMTPTEQRARIFLLSPATAHGKKGRVLLEDPPRTPVAKRLHAEGMPVGAVFTYLSGLYFNGKLAYARAFARPPRSLGEGIFILTLTDGLLTPDRVI
jgi:hypothetical protein